MHPVGTVALEEIAGGCPLLDAWHIEAMADQVDGLRRDDTAEGLAAGYGCEVVRTGMTSGLYGVRVPGMILVRWPAPPEIVVVTTLHELGHEVIRRHRVAHTHADVWALTLAMGAPLRVLREVRGHGAGRAAELGRRTGLPAWACAARLEMGAIAYTLPRAVGGPF